MSMILLVDKSRIHVIAIATHAPHEKPYGLCFGIFITDYGVAHRLEDQLLHGLDGGASLGAVENLGRSPRIRGID